MNWKMHMREISIMMKTGQIYTMDTFCHLTNILLDRSSDQFCAMALIHVSGGVEQMDGPEVSPGKRVRDFIEIAFLFALGSDCLVGYYSDDRILVFFPTTGNRFDIKRRLEDAFIYVRTSTGDISGMENLRFIAGVTVEDFGTGRFGQDAAPGFQSVQCMEKCIYGCGGLFR